MGIYDAHLGASGITESTKSGPLSPTSDISSTQQSIADSSSAFNFSSALSTVDSNSATLPWAAKNSNIDSKFFHYIDIDPSRWDELFPYSLLVIDSKNNQPVSGLSTANLENFEYGVSKGTSFATLNFGPPTPIWAMRLSGITPQQLNIQDQFAIQTTPTLRGISEEHGGVRFKMITAQGTFGVWPYRPALTQPPGTPSALQSLFGGTIEAAGSVVSSITSALSIASGSHPANKPTSIRPEDSDAGLTSTGYYKALKLQQFLEQYAEAKKDPKNASWRLVFDIPKQNQSFIVTPVTYNWHQDANKPMEISYNLQFKAWRRVTLGIDVGLQEASNQPISPGILQRILGTIDAARQTMSSIINLIGAVRSDVETPLEILRQLSLFVKDLAGVAISTADLPNQLVSDYKSSISTSINTLSTSIKSSSSDVATLASVAAVSAAASQVEGLSQAAVASGQLGSNASVSQSLNPTNAIFANPAANYSLLNQLPVSSLSLTSVQKNQVNNVVDDARATTVAQLKQNRAVILQLALQLSNSFGTGSAYYDNLYNLPAPTPRLIPITLDEYDILKSLYDVLTSFDILTATNQVDDDNIENALEYVAGLASTSNIAFTIPTSKVLAPVPFGLTIEGIAARYLGDPQRWLEIATLNGLRDPYIDETGFQLPLLSNAIGRQITVGSSLNLYVGQTVILNSLTQSMSPRTILGIDQLSDASFLITLDGLADLGNFLFADKAYLQAYLPGTVNSQQKIFIPSDLPVPTDSNIIPPTGTASDPLTGVSKVDWLIQDNGDLAVNNYGDFRYSYGLTNIIQALRIKFGTEAGKVLTHPTFGLNVKTGTMGSEVQVQALYNSINTMIQQDPRFTGVSKLQIRLNGPILAISMAVTIAGQKGVFPVTFALTP